MKKIPILILLVLLFGCIQNDSHQKLKIYDLTVHDSTGRFDGRHVGFEVFSKYKSGKPEKLIYYVDDTTLIHTILENGTIIRKYTYINDSIFEEINIDSTGQLFSKVNYLYNDTIPDLYKVTYYKEGNIVQEGYKGKDSLFLGIWTLFYENDSIVEFNNGYNGSGPPDTGYIYVKGILKGNTIRMENNNWIYKKLEN